MTAMKRQRLEAAGWSVASAKEFLKLSPEEKAAVESKLSTHADVSLKGIDNMTRIDKDRIVRSAVGSARLEGYKGSPKVKTAKKKDIKQAKTEAKTTSRR